MDDKLTAAVLTAAHMFRMGPADSEYDEKYAHNQVVEEYERWMDYMGDSDE